SPCRRHGVWRGNLLCSCYQSFYTITVSGEEQFHQCFVRCHGVASGQLVTHVGQVYAQLVERFIQGLCAHLVVPGYAISCLALYVVLGGVYPPVFGGFHNSFAVCICWKIFSALSMS